MSEYTKQEMQDAMTRFIESGGVIQQLPYIGPKEGFPTLD